jgi:TRAP-type transport system periplasmic protein
MVASGEFDLCYFNTSYLVELIPSLRIFDLPFLIFDRADIFGKLDGTLGKLLAAEVARLTPYRVLGFWDNGFRHMSNRVRPIARVQDCRGLRFRTVDSRLHQEVFSAFGFDPVHIDVRDLPRAAASLTIDGQENPLTNTLNLGIHRIQRYQTLTHHFFGAMAFLANADAIAALPAAVRDALGSAVEHATSMQRTLAAEADNLCYRKLVDEGCDFVAHNELELSGFKSAAKPICDRELRLIPPDIRRAFEA